MYNSASGQWSSASLSVARDDITATTVGDIAIFAGGYTNTGYSNVVDLYNAKTNQWSTATLAGTPNTVVAAVIGNLAIFTSNGDSTADIYNASTGQWSSGAIPDSDIIYNTAVSIINNAAAGIGNFAIFPCFDGNADIYNSATGGWSLKKLPSTGPVLGSAVVGTQAIFPCYDGTEDLFDALTGRWTTAALPETSFSFSTSVLGSKAILTSGSGYGGQGDTFSYGIMVSGLSNIFDAATGQTYTAKFFAPPAVTMGNQLMLISSAADSSQVQILTDTTPSASLSGIVATNGHRTADVTLVNSGDAPLKRGFWVNIYASTKSMLHSHAILLGRAKIHQSLAAGASLELQVPLSIPAGTAAGSYRVLGAVSVAGQATQFATGQEPLTVAARVRL
jgi:hypothetical protein